MRLFLFLNPYLPKIGIALVFLSAFFANLGVVHAGMGILIVSFFYSVLLIVFLRKPSRLYLWLLFFFILLNLGDTYTTWIVTRFTSDNMNKYEINPIIISLFRDDQPFVGMITLIFLKLAFSLYCIEPIYLLRELQRNRGYEFTLVGNKKSADYEHVFLPYVLSETKRRLKGLCSGRKSSYPDLTSEQKNFVATKLLRSSVNNVFIFSLILVLVDLNNISCIVFDNSWLPFIWGVIGVCGVIVFFRFRERIVWHFYRRSQEAILTGS